MGYRIKFILLIAFILQACSKEPKIEGGKLVTIESQKIANTLFYSGTVQPLHTVVVPSPADGVIVEMPFQYGEEVKANQLLFMISSTKFLNDYKAALMQYIKAKSDFNTSKSQLAESTFLHKNELISDDEFKLKKSNYYNSQLALLQAKDILENILHQLDIKDVDPYNLSISDIDKITKAMNVKESAENNLKMVAPVNGVILSANKGEEESKKLTKGDIVKQGDVLAIIGDMSGLSVRIKVNELTINQLHVGQKVKVTGIAFPDHVLQGAVKRVDKQGEPSGGGLPTFSAEVVVPHLAAAEQKEIHVGMSAKVEIDIEDQPRLMIPIAAIQEKNGISYVKIFDVDKNKIQDVAIKTGKTTVDSVAVLAGLKAGDKIVVPH